MTSSIFSSLPDSSCLVKLYNTGPHLPLFLWILETDESPVFFTRLDFARPGSNMREHDNEQNAMRRSRLYTLALATTISSRLCVVRARTCRKKLDCSTVTSVLRWASSDVCPTRKGAFEDELLDEGYVSIAIREYSIVTENETPKLSGEKNESSCT